MQPADTSCYTTSDLSRKSGDIIAEALVDHMVKTGVKALGFIGLADPYGENWYKVVSGLAGHSETFRHFRE